MTDYHLECPDNCTLKEGTKWGGVVTEGLVTGKTTRMIVAAVAEASKGAVRISTGTISRHKKHIVTTTPDVTDSPSGHKATNIEILETIIQKGFQNQKNWKPTISDTMKAMDMWFRLTQGNPFDELLETLAAASIAEDPSLGATDEAEDVIDA